MTRLLLLVISLLLAFSSFVRSEDKLRVYSFAGISCDSSPQLVNLDLSRNKCHNLAGGANSFKSFRHEDNIKWIDEVNEGTSVCRLVAYPAQGCRPEDELDSVSLPRDIQDCFGDFDEPALSIQFECKPMIFTFTETTTDIAFLTSWTLGTDGKATPHGVTTTRTSTFVAHTSLERREAEETAGHLEPRQDDNRKGIWMFHPWSLSPICYECYTYKRDDFTKFDCRSGPKNVVDCGPKPLDIDDSADTVVTTVTETVFSPTFTFTPVTTSTIHTGTSSSSSSSSSSSAAVQEAEVEVADGDIEKRSWHRRVRFENPFKLGTLVCADSEWEKRGKPENEIRLQRITPDMRKCNDDSNTQNLNFAEDLVVTLSATVTAPTVSPLRSTRTTTISIVRNVVEKDVEQQTELAQDAVPTHQDL